MLTKGEPSRDFILSPLTLFERPFHEHWFLIHMFQIQWDAPELDGIVGESWLQRRGD